MALVIADRVKETSTTEGVGTLTLSGSTFGSFQTFEDTIGNGNITYYCIENGVNFEIGVGTYSSAGNTLSRDTVLQSSNSDNKISLAGVSTVFCVVPAEKLLYTDENGQASIIETPLPLTRTDDGDYWQVYSTDITTRVVSFFMEESFDPEWRLGLKTTTTESIQPYYGYISGKDGFIELKGNNLVTLSIGDAAGEGLTFSHRLEEILKLTANNGTISVGTLLLSSDNTTSISNDSISQDVFSVDAGVGHLANLQTWNVGADEKAIIDADGNFSNSGDVYTSDVYLDNIRFSDGSVQSTAALPSTSGYLIDQNAEDIIALSGLIDGGGGSSTFPNDLTVSLAGGKTFGRYEDGDTIPASGLTAPDVITLAVTEPIDPTVNLSSSSSVDFNQTSVSVTLNFNHTINSLGANVSSASLEFRRANTGSWTVLSTSTTTPDSFVHSFTDTAFNTDQLNYRYIVTDSAGATATATLNINPDTYSAPSISFNVDAPSLSGPESDLSRERGNDESDLINGSVSRNETYVDIQTAQWQYRADGGAWQDIDTAISLPAAGGSLSTKNHLPSETTASTIQYRIEVVDDYQTTYSSTITVNFGLLIFYGPSSSTPATSANVRALPDRLFTNGNDTFNLNTGSTEINFTVAIPDTETISEVLDLDALNANITAEYVNNPFNVDDGGGTAVSYNVYTMTIAIPYSSDHRHQVTKG